MREAWLLGLFENATAAFVIWTIPALALATKRWWWPAAYLATTVSLFWWLTWSHMRSLEGARDPSGVGYVIEGPEFFGIVFVNMIVAVLALLIFFACIPVHVIAKRFAKSAEDLEQTE